jgi:hypothetical protein
MLLADADRKAASKFVFHGRGIPFLPVYETSGVKEISVTGGRSASV